VLQVTPPRFFFSSPLPAAQQGCQMVYFQTKNSNLGKYWRALEWKRLVYSMPFGIDYGRRVYFMANWLI
jgi:hypothetical protein